MGEQDDMDNQDDVREEDDIEEGEDHPREVLVSNGNEDAQGNT